MFKAILHGGLFFIHLCISLLVKAQPSAAPPSPLQYIARYKDIAIAEMMRSNIPASITLAQGIAESSFGTSALATNANNHFGIKCRGWKGPTYYMWDDDPEKSCFRKYPTAEDSYLDHSDFIVTGAHYKNCFLQGKDYKRWAHELKKAGYATNPQYAFLLIEKVEKYQLQRYDTMSLKPLGGDSARLTQGVEFNDNPETRNRKLSKLFETYQKGIFEKNGLRFAVAQKGEDPLAFAARFGIPYAKFLKYNEMEEDDLFFDFQFAFLQPKRFNYRGIEDFHVVQENENLYAISQFYGMRLEALQKLNNIPPGNDPFVGDTIQLKFPVAKRLRYQTAPARPKRTGAILPQKDTIPGLGGIPSVAPQFAPSLPPYVNSPWTEANATGLATELPKEYDAVQAPRAKPLPKPRPTAPGSGYTTSSPDSVTFGEKPFWETVRPAPPPPQEPEVPVPAPPPVKPEQSPQVFPGARPPSPAPTAPAAAPKARQHIVARGETLYSLARRYTTTVDALKKNNSLQTDALKEGQVLVLP